MVILLVVGLGLVGVFQWVSLNDWKWRSHGFIALTTNNEKNSTWKWLYTWFTIKLNPFSASMILISWMFCCFVRQNQFMIHKSSTVDLFYCTLWPLKILRYHSLRENDVKIKKNTLSATECPRKFVRWHYNWQNTFRLREFTYHYIINELVM